MSVLDLLKFKREIIANKSISEVIDSNKAFFSFMTFAKESGLTDDAIQEIRFATEQKRQLMPIEFEPNFKFLGFKVRIILS